MSNEDVVIESVIFHEGFSEVSFRPINAERNGVTKIETLAIPNDAAPKLLAEVLEAIEDFVSEGEVVWRNPPDRIGVPNG
jgi:hypothetical protein